jgi:hypothetical protein
MIPMRFWRSFVLVFVLAAPAASFACPVCIETSAAAPQATRQAQRRSIAVLLLPALLSMAVVAFIVARYQAPGDSL